MCQFYIPNSVPTESPKYFAQSVGPVTLNKHNIADHHKEDGMLLGDILLGLECPSCAE